MYKVSIGLILVYTVLLSCNNSASDASAGADSLPVEKTGISNDSEKSVTDSIEISLALAEKKTTMLLKGMERSVDSSINYREEDKNACNTWSLTSEAIKNIFNGAKEISGTEWDLSYAVYPCSYSGEVLWNDKKGTYKINAGSYAILTFSDSSIYLGFTSKELRSKFLAPPSEE